MCLGHVVLQGGEHSNWYLGDRCWRKFHEEAVVPFFPPSDMRVSNIPAGLLKYLRNTLSWPSAESYLHVGVEYKSYWRRVNCGSLYRETVFRGTNYDMVSRRALWPNVFVPVASDINMSTQEYHDIGRPSTSAYMDYSDLQHYTIVSRTCQEERAEVTSLGDDVYSHVQNEWIERSTVEMVDVGTQRDFYMRCLARDMYEQSRICYEERQEHIVKERQWEIERQHLQEGMTRLALEQDEARSRRARRQGASSST